MPLKPDLPEADEDGFRRLYIKSDDKKLIEFYKHREMFKDSDGNVFITTAHSD